MDLLSKLEVAVKLSFVELQRVATNDHCCYTQIFCEVNAWEEVL